MQTSFQPPVEEQATVSFRMQPDRAYRNGRGQERIICDLLEFPGLATCFFQQTESFCSLNWQWDNAEHLVVNLPELPGSEGNFIQYAWDATKGRFDDYVNGTAPQGREAISDLGPCGNGVRAP